MVNGYQCACATGWTGRDCDISTSQMNTNGNTQTGQQAGGEISPIISIDCSTGILQVIVNAHNLCPHHASQLMCQNSDYCCLRVVSSIDCHAFIAFVPAEFHPLNDFQGPYNVVKVG